jgi:hypothetical protein
MLPSYSRYQSVIPQYARNARMLQPLDPAGRYPGTSPLVREYSHLPSIPEE